MVSAKALASGLEPMASTGSIIGITDAANRRLDTCFCQPLGIANGNVLGGFNRSSRVKGLFTRIQNAVGLGLTVILSTRVRRWSPLVRDQCRIRLAKVSMIEP